MHLGKMICSASERKTAFLNPFRTVWYELLFREFPFAKQPVEYIIWRAGNSLKQPLSSVHISKNAKVSCHSFHAKIDDR